VQNAIQLFAATVREFGLSIVRKTFGAAAEQDTAPLGTPSGALRAPAAPFTAAVKTIDNKSGHGSGAGAVDQVAHE
jgi:hypothetical protein